MSNRIETSRYECGEESAKFDVGFTRLDPGVLFVVRPDTGELEQIYHVEVGSYESSQGYTRVETLPGQWYEVDGVTKFARRHEKP